MNKDLENQLGSALYDRINSMPMSDSERQVAMDAMRTARLLVDGCAWVAHKFAHLGDISFHRPSAQH
jgi:hypothetical protein